MAQITYPNKITGDLFTGSEATEVKTVVNVNAMNSDGHAASINNPHSVTKTQVGLGNVDNTSDADKPVSTAQLAAINSAGIPYGATSGSSTYTATMSPVVSAYTNGGLYHIRAGSTTTGSVTIDLGPGAKKLLTTTGSQAGTAHLIAGVDYIISYNSALDSGTGAFTVVGELIHGLMNARGNYDASANVWPSTSGSGPSGAVRHGDTWRISVAGTLGGQSVGVGDFITTSVDNPGQTDANWYIIPGITSLNLRASLTSFVTRETPSGSIPGTAFTLANTPIVGSECGFRNGVLMDEGDDYTISGANITLAVTLTTDDKLVFNYRK